MVVLLKYDCFVITAVEIFATKDISMDVRTLGKSWAMRFPELEGRVENYGDSGAEAN